MSNTETFELESYQGSSSVMTSIFSIVVVLNIKHSSNVPTLMFTFVLLRPHIGNDSASAVASMR